MLFKGQNLGKYKIISPLGSGGFGTVYLAEDTWIDKKVAIKVPHRQNLDFGELLREPRLLASLNHPNIVTDPHRREAGQRLLHRDGVRAGRDARERSSQRDGALDLTRALDFTCQICNAVDHAHRQGVIHRDLRPGNVLVTENGMLKVADFGTSRFLEIAAHGTTVIGSPPYMAPEQFQGKAVFASDIYSLGVTMYQMLTGVLPYDTPAPADLERLMRGELVSPPRLKNPKIPEGDQRHRDEGAGAGRHRRATSARRDLLDDVLAARTPAPRRHSRAAAAGAGGAGAAARRRRRRSRPACEARETPQPRFCWHCRKPLHARSDRCPFCDETQ